MNEHLERGPETPQEDDGRAVLEIDAQVTTGTESPPSTRASGGKRRKGLVWGIAIVAVILLVICAVAVAWLVIPRIQAGQMPQIIQDILPKGKQILLAFPDRDDVAELYLLKLGQAQDEGTLLAEEADQAFLAFGVWEEQALQGSIVGDYGGFVPGSNRLVFWYTADGDTVIQHMRTGDKEPTEIIESEAWGQVFTDPDLVFIRQRKGEQDHCYIAQPGSEAERVAKAGYCTISADGSTIIAVDQDQEGFTLTVMDINGENETTLLDQVEDVVFYRASGDASHIVYLQRQEEGQQLYLVERDTGDETRVGDEVSEITRYGFVPHSDIVYYVAKAEPEDALGLYTSESDRPLAEAVDFDVGFSPDGQHMVYLVEVAGEKILYVHSIEDDEDTEVLSGEQIAYHVVYTSPPRVLAVVAEEDEYSLYSASFDGNDVTELLNEDEANLRSISYVRDEPTLYVYMTDKDGERLLFVTPVDEDTGFRLLEEWALIALLNRSPDGRHLVFWGREDKKDDAVLYSIAVEEGADAVELDDDSDGFRNAVFTANGRSVLYTAITGRDPDDVSVYQVAVDGEGRSEELYEEAFLVDVRWDDLLPFSRVSQDLVEAGTVVDVTSKVEEVVVTPVVETVVVVTATPVVEKVVTRVVEETVVVATPTPTCTDPWGCVMYEQGEPIRLAYMFVVSGPSEALGIDSARGVEMAAEDKGDILGHRIEVIGEDSMCSPEGALTAATKVVADPDIVAVIGTSCSSAALSAIPVVCGANMPMISPSNGVAQLTAPDRPADHHCYLRTAPKDSVQAVATARFVRQYLGAETAATIHDGSAYSTALCQVFVEEFQKLGGTVTAQETVNWGDTDMRPALTRIAATEPDVIYYPVFAPEGSFITQQAKESAGLENTALVAADGMFSSYLLEMAGEAAMGLYLSNHIVYAAFGSDSEDPLGYGAAYQAFVQRYEAEYGEVPLAPFHANAYDAAMMTLAAIEKVAVNDHGTLVIGRKALLDALFATNDFPGLTGDLTCTPTGDCADPKVGLYEILNTDPASWKPGTGSDSNPRRVWP